MRALARLAALAVLALAPLRAMAQTGSCTNCIYNTSAPQNAQINIGTATIRGTLTVGNGLNVSSVTVSTAIAGVFIGSGSYITNLNATELKSGVVPSGRLVGPYTSLTGVGTIAAGTWEGTAVGTQFGGTGQNFSTTLQGSIPYFSAAGVMSALAPSTAGRVLQTSGAGSNPAWTGAPAVLGTNITSIPMANLVQGELPQTITVADSNISSVSAARVWGNISGKASNITGILQMSHLATGTFTTDQVASSITVTGVRSGWFGGPGQAILLNVGTDGRLTSISQSTFSVPTSSIQAGVLPDDVYLKAANVLAGNLGSSVIASSLNATGITPGMYGSAARTLITTMAGDGRVTGISQPLISLPMSQLQTGSLPSGITVPVTNIEAGTLPANVIAQTLNASGATPGTYGNGTQIPVITVNTEGRITVVGQTAVVGGSTVAATIDRDNNWQHQQTANSSWTIKADMMIGGALNLGETADSANEIFNDTVVHGDLDLDTPLEVTNGGTGASSFNESGVLYGQSGNTALESTASLGADGIVIGNGAAIRPSTGTLTGTADQVIVTREVTGFVLSAPQDISPTSSPTFDSLTLTNPLTVANGGTGTTSHTSHGVLVGQGSGAITTLPAMGAAGIVLGSSTSTDPSTGTITGTSDQVTVAQSAAGLTLSAPQDLAPYSGVTFGSISMNGSTGTITTQSSVTAASFHGDGSHLTGINALTGGTANYIPKWTGATTLGNAHIWDENSPVVTSTFTVMDYYMRVGADISGPAVAISSGIYGPNVCIGCGGTMLGQLVIAMPPGNGIPGHMAIYGDLAAASYISFADNDNGIDIQLGRYYGTQDFFLTTGGGFTRQYVTAGGMTGMGTGAGVSTPKYELDLRGSERVTGQLIVQATGTVQGNAFSVGDSSFSVTGGSATVAYSMTAARFVGDGSQLTGIGISTGAATLSPISGNGNSSSPITLTGAIPAVNVDLSTVTAALALKVDRNAPDQVNLSTVTAALALKVDRNAPDQVNLSTVTTALGLKLDLTGGTLSGTLTGTTFVSDISSSPIVYTSTISSPGGTNFYYGNGNPGARLRNGSGWFLGDFVTYGSNVGNLDLMGNSGSSAWMYLRLNDTSVSAGQIFGGLGWHSEDSSTGGEQVKARVLSRALDTYGSSDQKHRASIEFQFADVGGADPSTSTVVLTSTGISVIGAGGHIVAGGSVTASSFWGDGSHLSGLIAGIQLSSGADTNGTITNFPQQSAQNLLLSSASFDFSMNGSTAVVSIKGLQVLASTSVYPSGTISAADTRFQNCVANSTATLTMGNNKAMVCYAGTGSAAGHIGVNVMVDGQLIMGDATHGIYLPATSGTAPFCVMTASALSAGTHNFCLTAMSNGATITFPAASTINGAGVFQVQELATGGQGYAAPSLASGTITSTNYTATTMGPCATGSTVPFVSNGAPIRFHYSGTSQLSATGKTVFAPLVDGAFIDGMSSVKGITNSNSSTVGYGPLEFTYTARNISAGNHNVCLTAAVLTGGGTLTLTADTNYTNQFTAEEVRNAPGTGDVSSNGNNTLTGTLAVNGSVSFGVRNSSTSSNLVLTAAPSTITVEHGFGAAPTTFGAYLVNDTTNCGYAAGDRVILPSYAVSGTVGTAVFANATQVGFRHAGTVQVANKSSTADCAITPGNWRLVLWGKTF